MSDTTDHSEFIEVLRSTRTINSYMAADLLELHDRQGISLDNWSTAQEFVRQQVQISATIDVDLLRRAKDIPHPNGA